MVSTQVKLGMRFNMSPTTRWARLSRIRSGVSGREAE